MEILRINKELLPKVKEFLMRIPSIREIDEKVIENASVIIDEDKIFGILSFEIFEKRGLIRYFIFQKTIGDEIIKELFNDVVKNASKINLKELIAIALKDEIQEVFISLGFKPINNRHVFIGEEPVRMTEFDKAMIMKYQLNN